MAIYETPNKIVRIDKDTAIYVLEKVQEAVDYTLNNDSYVYIDNLGNEVEVRKAPYEMLETLENKLQNILKEIKGGNE